MNKTCFHSKIQIQPGYEDYKHLLEYIQDRCLWCNNKESMVYTNNVGIKDETIDCSNGYSEVTDDQE